METETTVLFIVSSLAGGCGRGTPALSLWPAHKNDHYCYHNVMLIYDFISQYLAVDQVLFLSLVFHG